MIQDLSGKVDSYLVSQEIHLCHRAQTGSGSRPASYPMDTGGTFARGKAAGCETDHSFPFSTDVRNAGSYTSTSQYVFMAWCL